MSYRGMGDATTAGTIQDAWTQRKANEFNAAMARFGGPSQAAAGIGAVVPMFRTSRPIAIPNPRLPGFDTSRLRRPFGTTDSASAEPPPVGPAPVAMMIGWGATVAVAAGIFWAVTNSGKATANRRSPRRRRRRTR
jgi:hypothetical protein